MWQKNVRYLDYNADSGISEYVRLKLIELLKSDFFFANPSSLHRLGQDSHRLLHEARLKIVNTLGNGISEQDLVFTSSGTESNQTIIRSAASQSDGVIMGAAEHSASLDLFPDLQKKMNFAHLLTIKANGQYDLQSLKALLALAHEKKLTSLFLSLFWANHETGVLNDLEALKKVLAESPVPVRLHLDAAQVWGKIELDLLSTQATWVSLSSHKIGAPSGTGIIWTKPGIVLLPLIEGTQSQGLRGGTENILGIIASGYAAEVLSPSLFQEKTKPLRDLFESLITGGRFWGQEVKRVSNTSRLSFLGFERYENWVELLDVHGFAVSHGSACKSKIIEPSSILLQMGATREQALNSIRVSFGANHTQDDVYELVDNLKKIIQKKLNFLHSEAR